MDNEYKFRFYKGDKVTAVAIIKAEVVEDAFKKADNILRQNPHLDDWEYVEDEKQLPQNIIK